MATIKMSIFKVKLLFCPPCKVKDGLQNGLSTHLSKHPFFFEKVLKFELLLIIASQQYPNSDDRTNWVYH